MQELLDALNRLWSIIPREKEFWSAIAGALVGGTIAYIVQIKTLREERRHREEDRNLVRQAQGHALLFKLIRIHSNFYGLQRHIESCFEEAAARKLNTDEPWQFVQPFANPPDPIHFSADEMGMLLAMKKDDTFNLVVSMDVIHNSLIEAVKLLNTERRALAERLKPDAVDGILVSGSFGSQEEALAIRPRMIDVNVLIETVRRQANRDFKESKEALVQLHQLLRDKLALTYKLQFSYDTAASS